MDARELHAQKKTDAQRQMKNFLYDFHQSHYQDECVLFSQQPLKEFVSDKIHNCVLSSEFKVIWEHFLLSLAIKRYGVDVFYSPYSHLPLLTGSRKICCVDHVGALQTSFWTSFMTPKFFSQAHRIIVRSQEAKEKLMQEYDISFQKINVIPFSIEDVYYQEHSPDEMSQFLSSHSLEQPYIFYRCLHSSKERIEQALKIIFSLMSYDPNMMFLLELMNEDDLNWVQATFQSSLSKKVMLLSSCDDQKRSLFYQGAWACFVDLEKDIFPVPLIEAMASEALVVAPSYPVVSEVMAGSGFSCDMTDGDMVIQIMEKITKTPFLKQDLKNRASIRSKDFNHRRLSNKIYDVFRQNSLA